MDILLSNFFGIPPVRLFGGWASECMIWNRAPKWIKRKIERQGFDHVLQSERAWLLSSLVVVGSDMWRAKALLIVKDGRFSKFKWQVAEVPT